jgi:hypothetical protein
MFNLGSLKAVILGLSFKDMRDFTFSILGAFEDNDGKEGDKGDEMYMMLAVTEWAEKYEGPQGDTPLAGDSPVEDRPLGPPKPTREVHLEIPPDTDFMILTAKVPNDMAEDFQKELPDWSPITYACEFMGKKESVNVEEWRGYGRRIWEAWFT